MGNSKLSEHVYSTLKSRILKGGIPSNNKFTEQELSKEFGISRTPVREALRQLAEEGIIDLLFNRGAYLKRITSKDIEEIYDIRKSLESFAITKAAGKITKLVLASIKKQLILCETIKNNHVRFQAFIQSDKMLHKTIIDLCGNTRLQKILENLYYIIDSFRVLDARVVLRLEESHKEHKLIYKSLVNKDAVAAKKLMEMHIENAKQNLLTDFKING